MRRSARSRSAGARRHFVQVIAHTVPEWALKKIFWKGFFPSEIALFAGAKLFSATERRTIIRDVAATGLADGTVVQSWNDPGQHFGSAAGEAGREAAQAVFWRVRSKCAGKGTPLDAAEAYYQFFRGSATAALIGGSGLLALARVAVSSGLAAGAGIGMLALAIAFFWRARGAGQNLAREAFRNVDVLLPPPKPAKVPAALGGAH